MNLDKIKYSIDHVAFTYHIYWIKEDLHYYGLRTASGCHPTDIWTTYFTSSDPIEELRKTIGEPDIIEIRKVFETFEKARDWESKVLRRLKVTQRDDWINQCSWPLYDGRGKNNPMFGKIPWNKGKKHSEETKKKISIANKGKKRTEEFKQKLSESQKGENNHFYGKKHSKETKEKISNANKNNIPWHKGKTGVYSKETLEKMSKSKENYVPWNKDKTGIYSENTLDKMKKSHKGLLSGEKHPNFGKFGKDHPNFGKKYKKRTS